LVIVDKRRITKKTLKKPRKKLIKRTLLGQNIIKSCFFIMVTG